MLPALLLLSGLAAAQDAQRGEVLGGLAGCEACHTAPEGQPCAGGHRVQTDFGTFVGPNLTPDPEHGLGQWTQADFYRAMRKGRGPHGTRYWPAFPFTSFTGMREAELDDLWAWLQSLPPSDRPDEPHEISRGRGQLVLWRPLVFHPRGPDASWSQGEYLVRAVGHCGECHTPRGSLGGLQERKHFQGSPGLGPPIHDLEWSAEEWADFLDSGMTPDYDIPGGEMGRVIRDGTARLSEGERRAMAEWLASPD